MRRLMNLVSDSSGGASYPDLIVSGGAENVEVFIVCCRKGIVILQ